MAGVDDVQCVLRLSMDSERAAFIGSAELRETLAA